MKSLLFFVLIILIVRLTPSIQAQEVIATSGNFFQNENVTISWTLGEPIIETFSSADMILTQGFQQPVLIVSTLIEEPGLDFQITAFPNPTNAHVNISTDALQGESLMYRVYDMQGRFIVSNLLEGTQTRVAFDDYPPGTYFIRITRDEKPVKTFKIIKQ